jgi:hypothetical protein
VHALIAQYAIYPSMLPHQSVSIIFKLTSTPTNVAAWKIPLISVKHFSGEASDVHSPGKPWPWPERTPSKAPSPRPPR